MTLSLACRFTTPTLVGGLSFGAGLGITLFGIMYMFIHDGMVHRRFPVSLSPAECSRIAQCVSVRIQTLCWLDSMSLWY
jgi:hypothetical protein